jgi:hypothetical protein
MKNNIKVKEKLKNNLSPLQEQWIEMFKRKIGQPMGIKVKNPFTGETIDVKYTEGLYKSILENTPTDEEIQEYINKVQTNKF